MQVIKLLLEALALTQERRGRACRSQQRTGGPIATATAPTAQTRFLKRPGAVRGSRRRGLKRPQPAGTSPPTARGFPRKTRRWKGRGRSGGKAPGPPPGVSPPALGPAAAAPLGKPRGRRWRLGGTGQSGPRGQRREAPTHVPPSLPPRPPPPHPGRAGAFPRKRAAAGRTQQQSEGEPGPRGGPRPGPALTVRAGRRVRLESEVRGGAA